MKKIFGSGLAGLASLVAASAWIGFAAPAHADAYIGIAIYDPPGPKVHIVHRTGPTAELAQAAALAACNAEYDQCQSVDSSPGCISVIAGPGVSWVYGVGYDIATARSHAQARSDEQGWTGANDAATHCAYGG